MTTSDLSGTKEIINNFSKSIHEQKKILDSELASLGVQGASQMSSYINQIFADNQQHDFEKILRGKAEEIIAQLTLNAFKKIGEGQQKEFEKAFDSSSLADIPAYKEVTEEKEYLVRTNKSNKNYWGLGGAVAGGAVGFFLGGPAGAALGASLGSACRLAGKSASAEYGKHNVVVGDNREEQRQSAIENYSKILPVILVQHVNSLYSPLRDAMLEYCIALENDINKLSSSFEKLTQGNK